MPALSSKLMIALATLGVASLAAMPASAGNVSLNTILNGPFADATGDPSDPTPGGAAFLFFDANQAGIVQTVQSVDLNLNHTYVGDLQVLVRYLPNGYTISDPNAPYIDAVLFDEIGDETVFYSNNLSGSYSFNSTAATTLQDAVTEDNDTAIIPNGTYRASEYYTPPDAPVTVDLTAAFAGQTLTGGDFYLIAFDFGVGDTGSLISATLNLTTAVPEPTSIASLGLAGAALIRRRK